MAREPKLAGVVRLPVSEHQIEKRDHGEIEEKVASSPRGSIRPGNAQGACATVESEGGFGEIYHSAARRPELVSASRLERNGVWAMLEAFMEV